MSCMTSRASEDLESEIQGCSKCTFQSRHQLAFSRAAMRGVGGSKPEGLCTSKPACANVVLRACRARRQPPHQVQVMPNRIFSPGMGLNKMPASQSRTCTAGVRISLRPQ